MDKDITHANLLSLFAIVALQMLSWTGIVQGPFEGYMEIFTAKFGGFSSVLALFHFALMRLFWYYQTTFLLTIVASGSLLLFMGHQLGYLHGQPVLYALGLFGGGAGLAGFLDLLWRSWRGSPQEKPYARMLLMAGVFIFYYAHAIAPMLQLSSALHPTTYDLYALRFDTLLFGDPSAAMSRLFKEWPWLDWAAISAYNSLPFFFSAMLAYHIGRNIPTPANFIWVMAISGVVGNLLYHLMPVAGPSYALKALASYSLQPDISLITLPLPLTLPRNGIPSLHFGWALLLYLNSRYFPWPLRLMLGMVLLLTTCATLGTGEHYLVDLFVAIPMVLFLFAACMPSTQGISVARWRAMLVGLTLTLGWILVLRVGLPFIAQMTWLAWIAVLATIVTCGMLYQGLFKEQVTPSQVFLPSFAPPAMQPGSVWLIGSAFFISGWAGLIYQVLFSKVLSYTFGGMSTATFTVMATYMAGMAIGAWLGGKLAEHHPKPLLAYAWCELGIALYCAMTPWIFTWVRESYVLLAGSHPPDAGSLVLLRASLGAAALLPPTMLMGMTLPFLARFLKQGACSLGYSVSILYGANTLGAAFGALMAGYFIIPLLGAWKTSLVAVACNLLAVVIALRLQKTSVATSALQSPKATNKIITNTRHTPWVPLIILLIGGFITMAMEVNYIHLLAVVVGNSVYGFSLMLFVFLLGLGAGSETARHLLRLPVSPILWLSWSELLLSASLLAGVFLWDAMPGYFASFIDVSSSMEFGSREMVRAAVCFAAMFPPAFVIGVIYPLAMEAVEKAAPEQAVPMLGRAAAWNTFGNIVGVLVGGFVLLHQLGALQAIQLLAMIAAGLGVFAYAASPRGFLWPTSVLTGAVLLLWFLQPATLNYQALASGANVYFFPQRYGKVIEHAESLDGGLTTVMETNRPGFGPIHTLLTNGKFQGSNDIEGEVSAQYGFAMAPLLHTSRRDHSLVIGFGTGVTSRVLLQAGFQHLDIVDISSDIVRLATKYFSGSYGSLIDKPNTKTYITDGRNFLLLNQQNYDLISMEVSSIWFAGSASLYSQEFYKIIKKRLKPDGVLQQWVQLHHTYPLDILYILSTLREEFNYVWFYYIGNQGILVATNDPQQQPRPETFSQLENTDALKDVLSKLGPASSMPQKFLLFQPHTMDAMLNTYRRPGSGALLSTDDNLFLEYHTPRGNVLEGDISLDNNVLWLKNHAEP